MLKQTSSKFISLVALGLLVIIFGFILLVLAVPLFATNTSHAGVFVFALSRRTFTIALMALLLAGAVALFLFARALRFRI